MNWVNLLWGIVDTAIYSLVGIIMMVETQRAMILTA